PAPFNSARVAVDLAFTSTQSSLPPERSALDARPVTASLRLASSPNGPLCCPKAKADKNTKTPIVRTTRSSHKLRYDLITDKHSQGWSAIVVSLACVNHRAIPDVAVWT